MKWLVACVAATLFLTSCSERELTSASMVAEKPQRDRVRMSLPLSVAAGPAVIAHAEGFFADEGIDFEIMRLDANSALLGVASGSLDVFTNPVRSGIFNMIARGTRIQIVADGTHSTAGPCVPEGFTAPPALARRVKAKGLRGQRLATIKGGSTEYLMTRLLASQGLTTADVEMVEYPAGESSTGEFRVLDAVRFNFEPSLTVQREKGLIEMVATAQDVAPGYQRIVIGFGKRLLDDDPELGRRFMRGWLKGVRRYNEGKTEGNVSILSNFTQLPPDLIRKTCWPSISADGMINLDGVRHMLEWMHQAGYLETEIPEAVWWNPDFAVTAARELGDESRAVE
ncbi:MAG TPA: ABC transporter substrate-binding protein [Thermoanaerobaculia bacterium]